MLKIIQDGWCSIDENVIHLNLNSQDYWFNDDSFYLVAYNAVRFAGHSNVVFTFDVDDILMTRVQNVISKLTYVYGIPATAVFVGQETIDACAGAAVKTEPEEVIENIATVATENLVQITDTNEAQIKPQVTIKPRKKK